MGLFCATSSLLSWGNEPFESVLIELCVALYKGGNLNQSINSMQRSLLSSGYSYADTPLAGTLQPDIQHIMAATFLT
jgi:hypothetical protein